MQYILKLSELDSHRSPRSPTDTRSIPSPSTSIIISNGHPPNSPSKFKPNGAAVNLSQANGAGPSDDTTVALRAKAQDIQLRIANKDAKIQSLEKCIQEMVTELDFEKDQRADLLKKLEDLKNASRTGALNASGSGSRKGKGKMTGGINYEDGNFVWLSSLRKKMRNVFGIENFRLCQLGYASFAY